jgi:hypothetical protein
MYADPKHGVYLFNRKGPSDIQAMDPVFRRCCHKICGLINQPSVSNNGGEGIDGQLNLH